MKRKKEGEKHSPSIYSLRVRMHAVCAQIKKCTIKIQTQQNDKSMKSRYTARKTAKYKNIALH